MSSNSRGCLVYVGAEHFLDRDGKLKATATKRVGISGMKAPARAHTEIFTPDGAKKIGEITSGGFGPSFQGAVAMGYIETDFAKEGTAIAVSVRGKLNEAQVRSDCLRSVVSISLVSSSCSVAISIPS